MQRGLILLIWYLTTIIEHYCRDYIIQVESPYSNVRSLRVRAKVASNILQSAFSVDQCIFILTVLYPPIIDAAGFSDAKVKLRLSRVV
jgi:hypothetical protein